MPDRLRLALHDCHARLASPRRRAALAVLAAVLLAHGLGLGLLRHAPGPGWQPDALRPLQVRRIASTAADGLTAAVAPPQAAVVAAQPRSPAPLRATQPAAAPPAHASRPSITPVALPSHAVSGADAPATDAPTTNAPTAAIAPVGSEPTPDPGGTQVPVYATQLPPPVTLHYQLRRGPASGSAELRWTPSANGYQLELDGDLPRQRVIAWASTGNLDAHGIAPERYAESRRGRELRAANFQRDAGRITFSGPQVQHPLLPGAQDRLSWLLQLPAVLAANPALAEPGAQVAMLVAGSRGDAEVWTFAVIGIETVALPGGDVAGAVHLRREPARPYDTLADVWLDPARHHLPVRLQLRLKAGGDGTELLLLTSPAQP